MRKSSEASRCDDRAIEAKEYEPYLLAEFWKSRRLPEAELIENFVLDEKEIVVRRGEGPIAPSGAQFDNAQRRVSEMRA